MSNSGPVQPTPDARGVLHPLGLGEVSFAGGGLLGDWQRRNVERTLPHVRGKLEESGALGNLRLVTGEATGEFRNFWFADSDVYKTLEAAAWRLAAEPGDEDLRAFVERTASLLAKAQQDDGYLNSHFTVVKPEVRWKELHWSHELYCAGHLIQAAVAAARAGVGDELVTVARRFADLIVERFGEVDDIDGHPIIETALAELYRLTGHRPYLDLAARFLDLRGRGLLNAEHFGAAYLQDHVPVREADEVAGHAVRQLYLLAGMVDVAVETGDEALLDASVRLWEDAFGRKTYLTGAHGSRHRDEAFGDPYELPADRAYAETCAAIASLQWNWRMLLATGGARYADEMERALYNAIAGSTSLDGTHFFYSNPLHLRTGHDGSHEDAPAERLPWYKCACCPPNLARLFASLPGYAATSTADGVQLHLYAAGRIRSGRADIDVETEYPWDGRVTLDVRGPGRFGLSLRVPGWCAEATVHIDGVRVHAAPENGYLRIDRDWSGGATVVLDLAMPVRTVAPHPRVDAVRGCVALTRGPLVYCLEQADLPEGVVLEDVRIDAAADVAVDPRPGTRVPVALIARGAVEAPAAGGLYPVAGGAARSTPLSLTAVPYFLWGNRSPGPMRVWIPEAAAGRTE